MLKLAAIAAMISGVVLAPTAHADIDDYFSYLERNGIAISDATAAVDTGLLVCSALANGTSAVSLVRELYREIDWASMDDAAVIVVAAVHGLCPENRFRLTSQRQQIA